MEKGPRGVTDETPGLTSLFDVDFQKKLESTAISKRESSSSKSRRDAVE